MILITFEKNYWHTHVVRSVKLNLHTQSWKYRIKQVLGLKSKIRAERPTTCDVFLP